MTKYSYVSICCLKRHNVTGCSNIQGLGALTSDFITIRERISQQLKICCLQLKESRGIMGNMMCIRCQLVTNPGNMLRHF